MTVGQWLYIWTAEYLGAVKPRTADHYKGVVRSRIKPGLGAIKLDALTPHTIQSYYNGLSKEGLAPKTVKIHTGYYTKLCSRPFPTAISRPIQQIPVSSPVLFGAS